MSNSMNRIAGSGQHSHSVPTVEGVVVDILDGNQCDGLSVWLRADGSFAFADHARGTVDTAARCALLRGQDVEKIGGDYVYGCDLESPDGLVLIALDEDDDLSWLTEGASIVWDSAGGIALVGTDGTRPVVWAVGNTRADALAETGNQELSTREIEALEEHEVTAAQRAAIVAGNVAWPVSA